MLECETYPRSVLEGGTTHGPLDMHESRPDPTIPRIPRDPLRSLVSDLRELIFQDLALYPPGSSDPDEVEYISGSPRVSLELKHPFTVYVFIELDKARIAQLEALKAEFEAPERRIFIREEDCNTYFNKLLSEYSAADWKRHWRGVVFLDPFGMQVPWETIAAIARTRAIEVILKMGIRFTQPGNSLSWVPAALCQRRPVRLRHPRPVPRNSVSVDIGTAWTAFSSMR